MNKNFILSVIIAVAMLSLLASCNTADTTQRSASTEVEKLKAPFDLNIPQYRRYTGTIAGQPVVVNIQCYDGAITGAYSNESEQKIIALFEDDEKQTTSGKYTLYEKIPTERLDGNDYKNNAYWLITFVSDSIIGEWVSRDTKRRFAIRLKEDYSGAFKLNVIGRKDSVMVKKGKDSAFAKASDQIVLLVPAQEPSTVANKLILKKHCDANDYETCIRSGNEAYFKKYKEEMADGDLYNYEETSKTTVLYNNKNWLILQLFGYSYFGGAHGIYGSSYCNLDLQSHKEWTLADMINVDTVALLSLLDREARRSFNIAPQENLNEQLNANTIPFTDNVYITPAGIAFCYGPYEIGSFADGEISLFIPFSRLEVMLKDEFKKRMNLLN